MVAYTSLLAFTATLFTLATAAPNQMAPAQDGQQPVIHKITAGKDGLKFSPDNLKASPGEWIEFHFLPKNHSIVQSSFDKPCEPLPKGKGGVFSGFNFAVAAGATANGEAENVFRFQVKNTEPFWYYCSQTVGNHCQMGMSGVINEKEGQQEKTLVKYKEAAKTAVTKQACSDPKKSCGGKIVPNTVEVVEETEEAVENTEEAQIQY